MASIQALESRLIAFEAKLANAPTLLILQQENAALHAKLRTLTAQIDGLISSLSEANELVDFADTAIRVLGARLEFTMREIQQSREVCGLLDVAPRTIRVSLWEMYEERLAAQKAEIIHALAAQEAVARAAALTGGGAVGIGTTGGANGGDGSADLPHPAQQQPATGEGAEAGEGASGEAGEGGINSGAVATACLG